MLIALICGIQQIFMLVLLRLLFAILVKLYVIGLWLFSPFAPALNHLSIIFVEIAFKSS